LASIKTQFSVGIFVIIGFTVVAAAVIWLGLSHYLQKGQYYVAYFDESVQGLDRDSPVKYRGVAIGRVDRLGVAPDGRLIEAVIKIESIESGVKPEEQWIAQLTAVGITGLMFVELDQRSPGEESLSPEIDFPTEYPMIPTKPSGIKQIVEGVGDLIDQLKTVDFVAISTRLQRAIERFDSTLEDASVEELSGDLRAAIQAVKALASNPKWRELLAAGEGAGTAFADLSRTAEGAVGNIDRAVASVDGNFEAMKIEFNGALADFRSAVAKADRFFEDGSELAVDGNLRVARLERQLAVTLRELRTSSEHLNRLLEEISEQPSRLLFGEPSPPRAVEAPGEP
jgi:phospholipid/cholesterol/gamma-HCH transport system substrate-binding protein